MHMRMMMESACPCVQDRKDAHLGTDVAFLGSKIAYCIGSNLHQQTIERLLMPQKQSAQLAGDSSDQVEIPAGQDLGGSALQPIRNLSTVAFRARSISAAVVTPEGLITVIAAVAPTTHGLSHASGNILQRPVVRRQHEMTKLFRIGIGEAAYDIGQFELWLIHGRPLP